MSATSGSLNITLNSSNGSLVLGDNITFSSGTITTEEMQKGLAKAVVKKVKILSTDYNIEDFNDDDELNVKLTNAYTLLNSYKKEKERYTTLLKLANDNLTTYDNKQKTNGESKDTDYRQVLLKLCNEALVNKVKYETLVDNFTNYINALEQNGEYIETVVSQEYGSDETEEEIDLDNLIISQAPGMTISASITNAVTSYLEITIQSLIADGATNVLNNLGINQDTIELANTIVNMLDNTVMKINSIIPFVPKNIHMVPGPKSALNSIQTSLKDMFNAMYLNVENYYNETINEAITNLPSAQEILKDSLELLMNTAQSLIDEQCVKYTGYTTVELYYKCSSYIALYKEWKRARAEKRKLKEELEQEEAETGIHNESDVTTSSSVSINVDDEAVKQAFLDKLSQASDLIFNGFFIILMQDAFEELKMLIALFNEIDLEVLTEGINSFNDLMNLFDELGLNDDGAVITLEESITQGINQFSGNVNSLQDLLKQQAIATSAAVSAAVIANSSISVNTSATYVYDFNCDLNKLEMNLIIYSDPTVNSARKKIQSALLNAKQKDGTKIFSAADVLTIISYINKGYEDKEDKTIELVNFTFNIKFEIEGFNQKLDIDKDYTADLVDLFLKEEEIKYQLNVADAMGNFELGVITEEYSSDPTQSAKRPTFQLIHEVFAILKKIYPILQQFAVLISNYKINKLKAEHYGEANVFACIAAIAKINNLLKTVNTNDLNFYTIRTLKLYNYVTSNIKKPDNDTEIHLDSIETRKFYLYLKANDLNYSDLSQDKNTLLYIDSDSINELRKQVEEQMNSLEYYFKDNADLFIDYPETNYKDGDTLGLNKLEIAGDTVFYTDSSLPLYGSQIMTCFSHNYDVSI